MLRWFCASQCLAQGYFQQLALRQNAREREKCFCTFCSFVYLSKLAPDFGCFDECIFFIQLRNENDVSIGENKTSFFIFLNMGHPRPLFSLFSTFQANITIFTTNYVKNVHPVYGAGIRTHNLQNMSLLP